MQQVFGKQPATAEYSCQRNHLRQDAGEFQRSTQQKKHAGNALTQKRIAVKGLALQHGEFRREQALLGNAFDEGKVHGQVAVGALPAPVTTVFIIKSMGMQQPDGKQKERHHTGPEGGNNGPGGAARLARRFTRHSVSGPESGCCQCSRGNQRQQGGGQSEAQRQCEERGKRDQQHQPEGGGEDKLFFSAGRGQEPSCQRKTGGQKYGHVNNTE